MLGMTHNKYIIYLCIYNTDFYNIMHKHILEHTPLKSVQDWEDSNMFRSCWSQDHMTHVQMFKLAGWQNYFLGSLAWQHAQLSSRCFLSKQKKERTFEGIWYVITPLFQIIIYFINSQPLLWKVQVFLHRGACHALLQVLKKQAVFY